MDRQELYCHNCNRYARFDVPADNGNLIVVCPNCSHNHYRVVMNGIITADRWGSANHPIMYASGTTSYYVSYATTSSTADSFLSQSWVNSSTSA